MEFKWIISTLAIYQLLSGIKAHFYPIQPSHSHVKTNLGNSWSNIYINHDDYSSNVFDFPSFENVHNNHLPPIANSHFVPNNFVSRKPYVAPFEIQHRAVILTQFDENQLPSELKNPFYKNPRIRAALADASRLHQGEMPVFHRSAENIPRSEIYKLLIHAGFLNKNNYY